MGVLVLVSSGANLEFQGLTLDIRGNMNTSMLKQAMLVLLVATGCQGAGWKTIGSAEYQAFPQQLSWEEAQAACQEQQANLASLLDFSAFSGVAGLCFQDWPGLWIGAFQPSSGSSSGWGWVDNSAWDYTAWSVGSPSGDGNCTELYGDENGIAWNDLNCDHKRAYLCKRPVNEEL